MFASTVEGAPDTQDAPDTLDGSVCPHGVLDVFCEHPDCAGPLIDLRSAPGARMALQLQVAGEMPGLLDRAEVLDAVEAAEQMTRWVAGVRNRMLAEFVERHPADSVTAPPGADQSAAVPSQRWVPDEVGLTLQTSRHEARSDIELAKRFVHVLPETLAQLEAGRIDLRRAEAIATVTAVLPDDKARAVQERVLPKAHDATLRQLRDRLRRAIARIDPDGDYRRHKEADRKRQVSIRSLDEGMASLSFYGSAAEVEAAWQTADRLARSLGKDDPRTLDQRRFDLSMDILQGRLTVTSKADLQAAVAEVLAERAHTDQNTGGQADADQNTGQNTTGQAEADQDSAGQAEADLGATGQADAGQSAARQADAGQSATGQTDPCRADTGQADADEAGTADQTDAGKADASERDASERDACECDACECDACECDADSGGSDETGTAETGTAETGTDAAAASRTDTDLAQPRPADTATHGDAGTDADTATHADSDADAAARTGTTAGTGTTGGVESAAGAGTAATAAPAGGGVPPGRADPHSACPDRPPPGDPIPPEILADVVAEALSRRPDLRGVGHKPLIQVVVGIDTLMGSNRPADLIGHGPIDADTARALAADSVIVRLLTDRATGTVVEHGRKHYAPPAALADHVRSRDQHCRGPRCYCRVRDLDHHQDWALGGTTDDANLYGHCKHCHQLKDVPGWHSITDPKDPNGEVVWVSPCGRTTTSRPYDYRDVTDDLPGWNAHPPEAWEPLSGPANDTEPDDTPPPF